MLDSFRYSVQEDSENIRTWICLNNHFLFSVMLNEHNLRYLEKERLLSIEVSAISLVNPLLVVFETFLMRIDRCYLGEI